MLPVALGPLAEDTIAPAVLALVERGVRQRSSVALEMAGAVALRFDEGYPTVRIAFGDEEVLVEDSDAPADAFVAGRLPDVVALLVAPLTAGVPNPLSRDGRGALGLLARGNVEIGGSVTLARRLLQLLSLR